MDEDEKIRRAAHIILDGLTATAADGRDVASDAAGGPDGPDGPDDAAVDAQALAFQALLDIEALEISFDEDEEELELDISPLMSGVMLVVRQLVGEVARRDGSTPDDVVALVRGAIDAG